MFQKLYQHLEEINKHLRQDKTQAAGNRLGDKLDQLIQLEQERSAETRILETSRVKRYMPIANLFISCTGIIVIVALSFYTFKLVQITEKLSKAGIQSSAKATQSEDLPQRSFALMEDSTDRYHVLQEHLTKLDSLITEQAQAIKELKKLNVVAVATFRHIRKHLSFADSIKRVQPRTMDSLALAR